MYTPKNVSEGSSSSVIIFFHGGGFFFGSICKLFFFRRRMYSFIYIDSHDTMNYHLSMYTGAKVIAVK
jgi:acetyl esterase/lipase